MLINVKCPAKVNPLLKVSPADETGFHLVEMVYQTIGLFDSLEIDSDVYKTTLTTNWLDIPVENSLHKVLNFAKEVYDLPPLKIHLTKRIPTQSGLGSESSNAAGLLRALEILFPHAFSPSIQLEIANTIGNDVPFFLHGGRARTTNRSKIIEPLQDNPSSWMCIIKPSIDIYEEKAYDVIKKRNYPNDDQTLNTFEKMMPTICHDIKEILIREQAVHTQLCGTGSAVYGSFLTQGQAQQAALLFVAKGFTDTFVVSTLTKQGSLWISYF